MCVWILSLVIRHVPDISDLYAKYVEISTETYSSYLNAKHKQNILRATNASSSSDPSDNQRVLLQWIDKF
jgi:hypothetical protein